MSNVFNIAIASDHAGFPMKEMLISKIEAMGHVVIDFGTRSESSVDFSDFVYPAALAVSSGEVHRGILIDGAGYPSGIVANMLPGVFAAVVADVVAARISREHSDTNVLCLGGKTIGPLVAEHIVKVWLTTDFAGGRYAGRVNKLKRLALTHRVKAGLPGRKVITVQDVKQAIERKETLHIDEDTIITPSVYDLLK